MIRSTEADWKLINVSSCTVETYIPIASASQPDAMMYLAGYFPASLPTMGISNSTTNPPPDRTSPAFSAVYPVTVCRQQRAQGPQTLTARAFAHLSSKKETEVSSQAAIDRITKR